VSPRDDWRAESGSMIRTESLSCRGLGELRVGEGCGEFSFASTITPGKSTSSHTMRSGIALG